MGYVDKQLLSDEKTVFKTTKHWVVFFPGAAWLVLAVFSYYLHVFHYAALIPFSIAILVLLINSIDYFFLKNIVFGQRLFHQFY